MSTYYIRKRGKVAGPFTIDQLSRFRDQGRLSRTHEISLDGEEWESALSFEGVFDGPSSVTTAIAPRSVSVEWYYFQDEERLGPISESAMVSLIENRRITQSTLVWTTGLENWVAAESVEQFFEAVSQASRTVSATSQQASETAEAINSSIPAGSQVYCHGCGVIVHKTAPLCPSCGAARLPTGKNKLIAALLAIFLSSLGAHRFYLGQWWGIFYLLFSLTFIPQLIGIIEGIVFLCTSDAKWQEKYGY
jgi:hypothetical protein